MNKALPALPRKAPAQDGRHRRHHLGRPDHAASRAWRPPQARHIASA